MDILSATLIVLGLIAFEVVSSIDNAVINAETLSTMSQKARRFFVTWGIFFAVFVVRGLLPWLIVWATVPALGFFGSFTATFSNDPSVAEAIKTSAPILLLGGGVFLLFLFFHWLFIEEKNFGWHKVEPFFLRQGAWFYATVSIVLMVIVWYALKESAMLAFGAVVGSTAFFITHGFRQHAEAMEKRLSRRDSGISDISKILYLEVIDLSFSIDGVLGAFAFTLSVPLILIGNGIGAIVIRQLTVANIDRVKQYLYLKNGAMYSIAVLGCVMVGHAFGAHIPEWFAPLSTILIIVYFYRRSLNIMKKTRG
ncbi:MAG: DUF475 domain-containing protein [Candidatus Pacebacteria bacterium]|jgi:hypothetical protein|nr:DUF475 domain-containing protein [Candidatus Paceibacterota bacterium]